MDAIIELSCSLCGAVFTRRLTEHNRNIKKGRKVFCGNACSARATLPQKIPDYKAGRPKNITPGSEKDEFSPFRSLMKVMRLREHKDNKHVNVTLQDLKELWEKQGGRCPYTGWQLVLHTSTKDKPPKTPNRASVDRIDSSRGYEKDNIQIVSMIYQFAKNSWSDADVKHFCDAVSNRDRY